MRDINIDVSCHLMEYNMKRYNKLLIFVSVILMSVISLFLTSCDANLNEEPPRYEKSQDYILPSAEVPTDEERNAVNEDVLEYLNLYM